MAILNMVVGGLLLICDFIATIGLGTAQGRALALMHEHVPGYMAVNVTELLFLFLLAIVIVIAGIGLLLMQPWARWASMCWAISIVLCQVASSIYELVIVSPASPTNGIGSALFGIMFACLLIVYAIALVIVMWLPSVSAAFAGQGKRTYETRETSQRHQYPRRERDG
jgi:hypothetical protein